MVVEQVMSAPVLAVSPECSVGDALARLHASSFRHLPVVRLGKLVGMVSDRDLRVARALAEEPRVGTLARTDVVAVAPETSIEEAADLMRRHKIGVLPVVRDGQLVGIVTESDLLGLLARPMGAVVPGARPDRNGAICPDPFCRVCTAAEGASRSTGTARRVECGAP